MPSMVHFVEFASKFFFYFENRNGTFAVLVLAIPAFSCLKYKK